MKCKSYKRIHVVHCSLHYTKHAVFGHMHLQSMIFFAATPGQDLVVLVYVAAVS